MSLGDKEKWEKNSTCYMWSLHHDIVAKNIYNAKFIKSPVIVMWIKRKEQRIDGI